MRNWGPTFPGHCVVVPPDRGGRGPALGRRPQRPAPSTNPYKGLRAFREADAPDFFGREALVDAAGSPGGDDPHARLLAVVGPSGCGKSSIVRAGLLPALRRGAARLGPLAVRDNPTARTAGRAGNAPACCRAAAEHHERSGARCARLAAWGQADPAG